MLRVLKAVGQDLRSYVWPLSKRANAIRVGVLALLIMIGGSYLSTPHEEPAVEATKKAVTVGTVADINGGDGTNFVGTVRAVSEAQIQSESAGRITSVRVAAGDSVQAGTIIATLENSAESAAVLQAQGAYEAALAGIRQSQIGATQTNLSKTDAQNAVTSAETNAKSTYDQAYTTTYNLITGTIDQFFSQPTSPNPTSRIGSSSINSSRAQLQTSLERWDTNRVSTNTTNLTTRIAEAESVIKQSISLLDQMIVITTTANNADQFQGQPLKNFTSTLTTAKTSLQGTLQSLTAAENAVDAAEDQLEKANVYDPGPTVDSAEANAKQALGALRAAQARLAKTILRSPISGTVNNLSVNTGDFVSAFTPIAEVANNGSLEISIFVGEQDLLKFSPEQEVLIEGAIRGVVTSIAPAVDSQTLKTEVKIASDDNSLTNGDTVTVTLQNAAITNEAAQTISVPLNAIRFVGDTSALLGVDADNRLFEIPVTLGPVRGTTVQVLKGADATTRFVFDVRGLTIGQEVTLNTN